MSIPRLKVTAPTIVAAATALSKLDAQGHTVERIENYNKEDAFLSDPRWTVEQGDAFSKTGALPPWAEEQMLVSAYQAFDDLTN